MRPWLALASLVVVTPAVAADSAATPTAPTPTAPPTSPGVSPQDRSRGAPPPTSPSALVSGSVATIDLQAHRIIVETASGRVELGWDRNTLIYQPGGATTASALRPGAVVKAGLDPARTAYWIQVRPPQPVPTPPPPAQAQPPLHGR